MTKHYTLIAYFTGDQAFIDRCGDFVAGEESEIIIKTYTNKQLDSLITDYANLKLRADKADRDFTLFIDGVDAYNLPEGHEFTEEEIIALENETDKIENLVSEKYTQILEEIKKKAEEEKQKAKELEAEKKLQKQKESEKKTEEAERKQLAELQAKYGAK